MRDAGKEKEKEEEGEEEEEEEKEEEEKETTKTGNTNVGVNKIEGIPSSTHPSSLLPPSFFFLPG